MIEIKLLEIGGIYSALNALHLPYGKGCKSTSRLNISVTDPNSVFSNWEALLSEHDENLLKKLIRTGDEHAKVTRGIVAYLEINAPRYWWVEFDTYRIGCEKLSSESTMHMQGKGLNEEELVKMKSELTEGTMQKRIVMISYQTLRRMHRQRAKHRLPEWREFCAWMCNNLPYGWMLNTLLF